MLKEYALFLSGTFDRLEYHENKPEDVDRKGIKWVETASTRHKYVGDSKKAGWVIEKGKAVCNVVRSHKKVSEIFLLMTEEETSSFLKTLDEKTFIVLLTVDTLEYKSDFFKDIKKKMTDHFGTKRTKELLV